MLHLTSADTVEIGSSGGSSSGSNSNYGSEGGSDLMYAAPSEIVLGGLFPRSGWSVGATCHAAAEMAIDEVNANPKLLPNTVMKHYWNDKLEY